MTDRIRPAAACWAAGLLFAVLAGCSGGPKTATVSGVVKVSGKEAEKGSITFIPADGKGQTAGAAIENGRYTAKVPHGAMRVEVRVPKVVGKKSLYGKDGPYGDITEDVLPAKYNDKTELTLDVTGDVVKDWDLQGK
jgi:hypothetical protein